MLSEFASIIIEEDCFLRSIVSTEARKFHQYGNFYSQQSFTDSLQTLGLVLDIPQAITRAPRVPNENRPIRPYNVLPGVKGACCFASCSPVPWYTFATMMAKRVDGGFHLKDCTLAKRSLAGHRSSCGGA
jgi:hypothetical protein